MRHEDGGHLHTAVVWLVTQGRKGTSWLDASYRGKSLSREIYARGEWDMRLIERLSTFEAYKDDTLLAEARAEIAKSVGPVLPTIVDPFCGGGSTVLEAQRLGLSTRASDLNPVPVLITTVLCRIPALFGNRPSINPNRNDALLDG